MDFVMIIGILVVFSIIVAIAIFSVKDGLKEKKQAQEKDQKEQTRHLENVEKLYISIYNKTTLPRFHKMVARLEDSYNAFKALEEAWLALDLGSDVY